MESKAQCVRIVRLQITKGDLQPFSMYDHSTEGGASNEERNETLCERLAIAMVLTTFCGNIRTASAEERTMQNYVYEGYEVDFDVTDAWEGAFNADVKITNTGESEICDWALTFEFAHEIQNLWNATVVKHTGNTYVIKNAEWNANIKPGEGVAFGMTVLCDKDIVFPENFSFVMAEEPVTSQSYFAEFILYSDWGTGCNGAILLSNLTDESIENWQLEFDYDREIVDISNAVIVSHEQGHYVIKNAEYHVGIAGNSSVHISIVAGEGAAEERPENFTMQQTVVGDASTGTEGGNEETSEDILEGEWITDDMSVKEVTLDDVAYNEETGESFAKNQVLVGAMHGVDKSIIEAIASELGAEIVGYLKYTEMYQFEFTENKTYKQLESIIDEIEKYSFINYASLNYVEYSESMYTPNDPYTDSWNINMPDGDNWGLEALKLPRVWDYKDHFKQTVKVGVFDSSFDSNHPDVKFKKILNNIFVSKDHHGTHVSGIIGATFDNSIGVSGVATDVELYGYCEQGVLSVLATESEKYTNLIVNNVKVINISYGFADQSVYLASTGNQKVIKRIEKEAKVLASNLKNLIVSGYDFLIVNAAGNSSNRYFKPDKFSYDGYKQCEDTDTGAVYLKYADAKYSYYANAIEDDLLKSRIIVVGNAEHEIVNGSTRYYVAADSGRGDRVDVYAPGTDIYSTANTEVGNEEYKYMSGTSMAAPHITGLAALIWQANPTLRTTEVKEIIVKSQENGHEVFERDTAITDVYHMPNAEVCIKTALGKPGGIMNEDAELPKGTIKGKVTDEESNALSDITVVLVRTSYGQANLKDYYYTVKTDQSGEYECTVIGGTYEINAYDSESKYLPVRVNGNVVSPEETLYMETIKLGKVPFSVIWNRAVSVQGKVYNAMNGAVIPNTSVNLRTGWNNTEGKYITKGTKTDSNGYFELKVAIGNYTVEIQKEGYIIGYYNVISVRNEADACESMILTPVLSDDEYRIILTWDAEPRDLDSHLTYYKDGVQMMHVYFYNKSGYVNGVNIATLDVDGTQGYGPETVTMTLKAEYIEGDGYFRYSVHKYSGVGDLSESNAIVRLYRGNSFVDTYSVPTGRIGNVWTVFRINQRGIQALNSFKTTSSASAIQ